jgi:hypothetical protein
MNAKLSRMNREKGSKEKLKSQREGAFRPGTGDRGEIIGLGTKPLCALE